jgi:hypothetical protein
MSREFQASHPSCPESGRTLGGRPEESQGSAIEVTGNAGNEPGNPGKLREISPNIRKPNEINGLRPRNIKEVRGGSR